MMIRNASSAPAGGPGQDGERPRSIPAADSRIGQLVETLRNYSIVMLDRDGRIQSWNRGAEELTGYRLRDVAGRRLGVLCTPEDRARGVPDHLLAAAAAAGQASVTGWRVRKDGTRFQALVTVEAVTAPDGSLLGFGEVIRDITAPRRERDTVERERLAEQRELLGQDLQGQTIPSLFAAGMALQAVMAGMESGRERDRIEQVVGSLDDCIRDLRRFISRMHAIATPGELQRELERLAADAEAEGGGTTEVAVDTEALRQLLPSAGGVITVVAEALSNVVRHARATVCQVRVFLDAGRPMVEIRDNGCGLDPSTVMAGGMASIRAWMVNAGSGGAVASGATGTTVLVRFPAGGHKQTASDPSRLAPGHEGTAEQTGHVVGRRLAARPVQAPSARQLG